MVAQSGQDVLIKIDLNEQGNFQTIGGMRSSKIALNTQAINATHMRSEAGWRELLEGGGVKAASLNGSGVFIDAETDAKMRSAFFEGAHLQLQFILPDFGIVEGKFQITSLEYSGNYDGEMKYDAAFSSAGLLSFLPLIEAESSV